MYPARRFRSVLLPHPLLPKIQTNSLSSILRLMSSSTLFLPPLLCGNSFVTLSILAFDSPHLLIQKAMAAFFLTSLPSLSLCLFVKLIIAVERIML